MGEYFLDNSQETYWRADTVDLDYARPLEAKFKKSVAEKEHDPEREAYDKELELMVRQSKSERWVEEEQHPEVQHPEVQLTPSELLSQQLSPGPVVPDFEQGPPTELSPP